MASVKNKPHLCYGKSFIFGYMHRASSERSHFFDDQFLSNINCYSILHIPYFYRTVCYRDQNCELRFCYLTSLIKSVSVLPCSVLKTTRKRTRFNLALQKTAFSIFPGELYLPRYYGSVKCSCAYASCICSFLDAH